MPGTEGVCSTCENPEHSPHSETAGHPFTMRVLATGYALNLVPDKCPACKDPRGEHKWFDLDQVGEVHGCDRSDGWLYR
jgi:hypothetical protein